LKQFLTLFFSKKNHSRKGCVIQGQFEELLGKKMKVKKKLDLFHVVKIILLDYSISNNNEEKRKKEKKIVLNFTLFTYQRIFK